MPDTATLRSMIASLYPDNGMQEITASRLRSGLSYIADLLDVPIVVGETFRDFDSLQATDKTFPAGTVIATEAEGFSYEVVASNPHLTLASGTMVRVLPKMGEWHLEAWGRDRLTTNASPSLQAALEAMADAGGGMVVLPPYPITLQQGVTLTLTGAWQNLQVGIRGVHMRRSRVIVNGATATHGIAINSPNARGVGYVAWDFSVLADGTVAGSPLAMTQIEGGSRANLSLLMENVECMGLSSADAHNGVDTDDYFTNGIDISGTWRARVRNVTCSGPFGSTIATYDDASVLYRMANGLIAHGCYDAHIDRCRFAAAHTGIRSYDPPDGPTNDPGPNSVTAEVFRVTRTQIDTVRVGIDYWRAGLEPQFTGTDNYINYRDAGYKIFGARVVRISEGFIDQKDVDNHAPTAPRDILIDCCSDVIVSNIHSNFVGDSRRIQFGIYDTDSVNAGRYTRRIDILDNHSTALLDKVLYVGVNVESVRYRKGRVDNFTSRHIENNGATPIELVLPKPHRCTVQRVATQSITASTWTSLSFDTLVEETLDGFWDASAPVTLSYPAFEGVTEVRVKARIVFSASATGTVREARLRHNGNAVASGFDDRKPRGSVAGEMVLCCDSGWIAAGTPASYLVQVSHDASSALTVTAHLQIEAR